MGRRYFGRVAVGLLMVSLLGCSGPDQTAIEWALVNGHKPTTGGKFQDYTCYGTTVNGILLGDTKTVLRINWRREETPGLKLLQKVVFGENNINSGAQIDVQNSTCNTFNAPTPSGGNVVLYTQFVCMDTPACPATLAFSSKVNTEEFVSDNLLDASKTYQVYVYADGSSSPAQVLTAKVVKTNPTRIIFKTPFQAPLQYTSSDPLFVEVVQE